MSVIWVSGGQLIQLANSQNAKSQWLFLMISKIADF